MVGYLAQLKTSKQVQRALISNVFICYVFNPNSQVQYKNRSKIEIAETNYKFDRFYFFRNLFVMAKKKILPACFEHLSIFFAGLINSSMMHTVFQHSFSKKNITKLILIFCNSILPLEFFV